MPQMALVLEITTVRIKSNRWHWCWRCAVQGLLLEVSLIISTNQRCQWDHAILGHVLVISSHWLIVIVQHSTQPNQRQTKEGHMCKSSCVRFSVGTLWQLKYGSSLDSSHVVVSGKWSLMSWNLFIAIIFFLNYHFFNKNHLNAFYLCFSNTF